MIRFTISIIVALAIVVAAAIWFRIKTNNFVTHSKDSPVSA